MTKGRRNRKRNRRGRNRNRTGGNISRTPNVALRRTFRYVRNYQINNVSGKGIDIYGYFTKCLQPRPDLAPGFKDACATFEAWRLNRVRVKVMPGYNSYNQTYNTINADAVAAMQVWSVADLTNTEVISGETIYSYNNAKVNTLSSNNLTTVCDYRPLLCSKGANSVILTNTWIDTANDLDPTQVSYSQFQLFVRTPGITATNYLPQFQVIIELDVEFRQPAYQNRPTSFESSFVGSTLEVTPAALDQGMRTYTVLYFKNDGADNEIFLIREDGEPGSLTYTQKEFWEVYVYQTSGKYFGGRRIIYTGPAPRRPVGWVRPMEDDQ